MKNKEFDVIVIGAGIIGTMIALDLQNKSCKTLLIDVSHDAAGASYGNAGLISITGCIPMTMPGTIQKLPKFLYEKKSPLSINTRYLLNYSSWFLNFFKNCYGNRPDIAANALNNLNKESLKLYKHFLKEEFDKYIKVSGQYHIFDKFNEKEYRLNKATQLRDKYRVNYKFIKKSDFLNENSKFQGEVGGGIFFPENGHIISTTALLKKLKNNFQDAGGEIITSRITGIIKENFVYELLSQNKNFYGKKLVIACGSWTNEVLGYIGLSVPLVSERGYHIETHNNTAISSPFIHQDYGIAVTPMADGIRFAGTVDFNNISAKPSIEKLEFIFEKAKEMFPDINLENSKKWVGSRPSSPDSIPIISALNKENSLFVATGHGHFGMVGAPMTAKVMSEILLGIDSGIDVNLYSIKRFNF